MWQERPHCSIIYYYNNYVTLLREIHQVYIEGEALEEMLTMWTPMVTIIIYVVFSRSLVPSKGSRLNCI